VVVSRGWHGSASPWKSAADQNGSKKVKKVIPPRSRWYDFFDLFAGGVKSTAQNIDVIFILGVQIDEERSHPMHLYNSVDTISPGNRIVH
jgi:hypothetical protein